MSQCHNAWPKQCGDAPVMNCLTKAENPAAREQSSEFCWDLVDDSHVNKTQLHSSQNWKITMDATLYQCIAPVVLVSWYNGHGKIFFGGGTTLAVTGAFRHRLAWLESHWWSCRQLLAAFKDQPDEASSMKQPWWVIQIHIDSILLLFWQSSKILFEIWIMLYTINSKSGYAKYDLQSHHTEGKTGEKAPEGSLHVFITAHCRGMVIASVLLDSDVSHGCWKMLFLFFSINSSFAAMILDQSPKHDAFIKCIMYTGLCINCFDCFCNYLFLIYTHVRYREGYHI